MEETESLAITGGPCAGKSSAGPYLYERLTNIGLSPLLVPEAATLLINAGFIPKLNFNLFSEKVFDTTFFLEQQMKEVAENMKKQHGLKPVLVCDRGLMDVSAYMTEKDFENLVLSRKMTVSDICDRRYKGVFHLRSAAIGAEEFYTIANNSARTESTEEARIRDAATLDAWIGHPHLRIIDNRADFSQKLERLFADICRVLGYPEPLEIERKFLVDYVDWPALPKHTQRVEIEQFYLVNDSLKEEVRFRRRTHRGAKTYYRTVKRVIRPGVRLEKEEFTDQEEYERNLRLAGPANGIIQKTRYCFAWNEQYFELDDFKIYPYNPFEKKKVILEIELTKENDTCTLPPFISINKAVTEDPRYNNRNIALYGFPE
ncbi:MAG TPA: AAA family ATPase [Candidatus Paceibacterota bacterium]